MTKNNEKVQIKIEKDKILWNKGGHLPYSIAKFARAAEKQELKGLEKYGKPLDPKNLNFDWLEMAEEEMVDGIKYLYAEQKKRHFIAEKIRKLLCVGDMSEDNYHEIHFWLDALEGK